MKAVPDSEPLSATIIRQEIARFIAAARRLDGQGHEQRRRRIRQAHHAWPLLVAAGDRPYDPDLPAMLHNASELGIAFLSPMSIPAGTTVFIKLFVQDSFCPRVPAVVRHCTPSRDGYLIGCEYRAAEVEVCEQGLELGRRSRARRLID